MYQNTGANKFIAPVFRFVESLVQLTEPHKHNRRLGAGGLALGSESGAVTDAVDDSSIYRPPHDSNGIYQFCSISPDLLVS